jgi:hypothetical protein
MSDADSKSREWWICQTEGYDGDAYDSDPDKWEPPGDMRGPQRHKHHVVEHSAYQEAVNLISRIEQVIISRGGIAEIESLIQDWKKK